MPARILIDGSNTLFWRGNQVDPDVPLTVVRALVARRFEPLIIFDASIQRHMTPLQITGLSEVVCVKTAPPGKSADEILLNASEGGRLQVVSNDRFRDWQRLFPAMRKQWRVTGRILKGGRVQFSKKLRPAPFEN